MPALEEAVAIRAVSAPDRLPTLTEVVQLATDPWAAAAVAPAAPAAPVPLLVDAIETPAALPPAPPVLDEERVTQLVLAELEQRLDSLFEARLRETLAPALARMADGLIRELRPELTQALHDMVHEAVLRTLQDKSLR